MNRHQAKAARYVFAGAANTLIYSTALYLFLEFFSFGSRVAVTLAYAIAVPFHFLMIRGYVFRSAAGEIHGQALRYAVMVAISYGISLAVVYVGVNVLDLASWVVVIANVAATTSVGFIVASVWVFQ